MPRIEIHITNLNELRAAFRRSPQVVADRLQDAIYGAALSVQREARMQAPVDTGILRSGIGITLSKLRAVVSPTAKYAIYVHEGTGRYARNGNGRKTPWAYTDSHGNTRFTHGQKANPFMERAATNSESSVQAIFSRAVQQIVGDMA